jgi:hypothetical protein
VYLLHASTVVICFQTVAFIASLRLVWLVGA